MKTRKYTVQRIFSILLALCMVVSTIPVTARAATTAFWPDPDTDFSSQTDFFSSSPIQDHLNDRMDAVQSVPMNTAVDSGTIVSLTVDGTNALSTPQGKGWSFDSSSGILTLSDASISGSNGYGVTAEGDLTIEMAPDTRNTISASLCGISVIGNLTIRGGSLDVLGTGTDSAGIYVSGSILVENCASLNAEANISGIYADTHITIRDSSVTATSTCTEAEIMSKENPGTPSALYANNYINVVSSTVTGTGNLFGISTYNLYANNSTLTATAGYFGFMTPFVSVQGSHIAGAGTVAAQDITTSSFNYFSAAMYACQATFFDSELDLEGGFMGLAVDGSNAYIELSECEGTITGGFVGMLSLDYTDIRNCTLTVGQTMSPEENLAYMNVFGFPCSPSGIFVTKPEGYLNIEDSDIQVSDGLVQLGAGAISLRNVSANLLDGCYNIFAGTSVTILDCPEITATFDPSATDYYITQGIAPFPPAAILSEGSILLSGCSNVDVTGSWYGILSMQSAVFVDNCQMDVAGGYCGIQGMYLELKLVSGTARGTWTPQEIQNMGAPGCFGLLASDIALVDTTLSAGQIGLLEESVYTVFDSQNQPMQTVAFEADSVTPPSEPEVTEPEIVIVAEGTCGDELTWVFTSDGVFTISGQGAMTDYSNGNTPWWDFQRQIQSVVIEEGVTSIGNDAFLYGEFASVTIPSSVTHIGNGAFSFNPNLTTVLLSNGLLSIGDSAFHGVGFTRVILPDTLVSIGSSAFYRSGLTEVTIPANVETIGLNALSAPNLTAIHVDEANEYFSSYDGILYQNPTALNDNTTTLLQVPGAYTGAVVPINDATEIADYAFAYCPYVEEVTFHARIKKLGGFVFVGCDALQTVHFQGDLPAGGYYSFDGLTVTVDYPAANTTWLIEEELPQYGGTVTWVPYGTDLVAYGLCGEYHPINNTLTPAPCDDNATWHLTSDGTLTISGTGKTTDCYLSGNHPWLAIAQNDATRITRVVVEEGITYLGSFSFLDFMGANITELVLPSTLTEFGHAACYDMNALTTVAIPEGVTALSTYVFSECDTLKNLDIPTSVTAIREGALSGCTALERIRFLGDAPAIASDALTGVTANAYYPTGNTTWSSDVLQNYGGTITWNSLDPNLLGEGTCGDGVTWTLAPNGRLTISGQGDMDGYSSANGHPWHDVEDYITSVYVEGTVNSIGTYSFYGLPNLTSVVIEEGVTAIGGHSMKYCPKLSSVLIPASVTEVGPSLFVESNLLTSAGPVGSGCHVQFGWTESIPADAFNRMYELTHVVLPGELLSIGDGAFLYCNALTTIDLPEGLVRIGKQAFESTGLTEIAFPDSVTEIGSEAFEYCPLVEVVLPANLQVVSGKLFHDCNKLTSVTIPASVTEIGLRAFGSCDSLETLRFEGDAPVFSSSVFDGTTVNALYPATNATWTRDKMQNYQGTVTWIAYSDADKVVSGWSGYTTWTLTADGALIFSGQGNMKTYSSISDTPWYLYLDQIRCVVLNPGITTVSDNAFLGCANLERLVLPDTVTSIGDYAFKGCESLNHVDLPVELNQLGESAFYGCTGLTSIEIPASLYTIKPYTFKNCTALTSVTFHEGNLQKISDGAFYGADLTELDLPDCLDILDVYAFKNCPSLESVSIGSGLTELREACFYGTPIREIEIPGNITRIGPYVFKNCLNLTAVKLYPINLTSIGEAAFYGNTQLAELSIPNTVTSIGDYAFRGCTGLTTVSLSYRLETIGEAAFYGCTGLTELAIPDSVTVIGEYAFKGCTGLTTVTFGNGLTTLGDSAFHSCTGLKTLVFPASLESIGSYCFSGSWNLYKLTFQGDAPSIGTSAFKGIEAYAYYPSGNESWTSDVMQNYGGDVTWKGI